MVLGDLRQPLLLLLLGAEQHQRLGDADRLVGGEQRRQRRVPRAGQRERAVVVDLRQAEAAVLLGHLHAERAELLEAVEHLVGDLRLALDLERVDLLVEEARSVVEERLALLDRGRRPAWAAGGSGRAGSCRGRAPCRSSAAPIARARSRRPACFLLAYLASHDDSLRSREYLRPAGVSLNTPIRRDHCSPPTPTSSAPPPPPDAADLQAASPRSTPPAR